MSNAIRLGDTVTGYYGEQVFTGVMSAISGSYVMVRLTADLLRANGKVHYPAGEEIALAPWEQKSLKLIKRREISADDVRYLDGHAWI